MIRNTQNFFAGVASFAIKYAQCPSFKTTSGKVSNTANTCINSEKITAKALEKKEKAFLCELAPPIPEEGTPEYAIWEAKFKEQVESLNAYNRELSHGNRSK